MLRWLGLGLVLGMGLGMGLGGVASAQGPAGFDGQYMGELTLTQTITGDCTPPPLGSLYPLEVSRGEVRFSYIPRFSTTLRGNIAKNGVFRASVRLRRGSIQMSGRIEGNHVTADILSPSCHYTFHTKQ